MKAKIALIRRSVNKDNTIIREEFVNFLECKNDLTDAKL